MNNTFKIFLLLAIIISGCSGSPMRRQLEAIDSLVDTHFDSALVLMEQIDVRSLSRPNRMYLELLRGKAMNKAAVPFTTDSVMKQVVRYYDNHGSLNQRMLAHYVLGCAYRDLLSAPRALEEYQRAVDLADTSSVDCDFSTLMRIHSQMAGLFEWQGLTNKQEQEDSIAEQLAWQIGDTLSALIFEETKCNTLYNKGEYEECINQTKILHDRFLLHGYPQEAIQSYILCAKSCLALKDFGKAKQYLDLYKTCSYLHDDPRKVNGGRGAISIYMAQYYMGVARTDSAEFFYRQALPYVHLNNSALLTFRGLSEVYAQLNKADSVLKYTSLYSKEKERVYNETIGRTTLQMASLYDYGVEQKIAREQSRRASLWEKTAIAFLCLILLVGYYYWKKRERVRMLRKELERKMDELNEAERTLESLRRQKTLSTSELKQKEAQILKLKGQAEYLCHTLQSAQKGKSLPPLVKSPIVQRFRRSLISIKEPPICEGDWKELAKIVSEYRPALNSLLGGVNLSENEYRLCLLVLCSFEPSQTDNLLGMKHSYSSKTRQRLHEKVFGAPGSAAEFDRKLQLYS
ncbi:MAG: hypothetical protein IKO73_04770 [Bacteroidaceae bacterium]|nr:hypothetical protein [Bacteroidaceae bacterium]